MEDRLKKQTITGLLQRLSRAGFAKTFVRSAILPDWWSDACEGDESLLPEVEIRVARFLGLSVSALTGHTVALSIPSYPGAQLRHVRGSDRDKLAPAIHSALQIASAAVRNLDESVSEPSVPPADALAWRKQISSSGDTNRLNAMVADLWQRGIPVVPLESLPTPNFQGLACIVEGRPVVILCQQYDEPGRVAFLIAHEIRHIVSGECKPGSPVVDQVDEIADEAESEREADQYATQVLVGTDTIPEMNANIGSHELANLAAVLERTKGMDAGAVIFTWARKTGDYATATMAVQALYRSRGARRLLRDHFDRHVHIDTASESDGVLLRCIFGHRDADAPAA